ncbi:MAG: hypothetical protein OEM05_11840 [Myxococcales bacterium]|nr:hypothetical protein [Myxococcales bacterium]
MATSGKDKGNGRWAARERAYSVGGRIAREQMRREAPLGEEALRRVAASDIVVVEGCYDRIQLVLGALELPHTSIRADQLGRTRLGTDQLLVINCPGHVPERVIPRIRDFVERGGSLFTTDWALRHVLEPAFPGLVEFNERPTADDVVRIEVKAGDNPFLKGVLEDGDDPQWWLESSSYPIRVLDPDRVEVLITSRELEDRYGEAPVAVLIRYGQGEIFHMISHYFLQRTELRNARHQQPAAAFAAGKGVVLEPAMQAAAADLSLGDVESAASSSRWLANIVADKKRKALGRRGRRTR